MKDVSWMAIVLAVLGITCGIAVTVQWWLLRKQRLISDYTEERLKSLWSNGETLFAEEWVLKLRVRVPKVDIQLMSCNELEHFYEQLVYYHSLASIATEYFSDGMYFVRRNGTMCRIVAGGIRANHYVEISAAINFEDIPSLEAMKDYLEAKPETAMERAKNCVLLDVHARGTGSRKGAADFDCEPRFAARNGQIIVESY